MILKRVVAASLFILMSNTVFLAVLYAIEWSSGLFSIQFINDYFFYSAILQWMIASFFMVSGKERNSIHNSSAPWTRGAASMIKSAPGRESLISSSDISLSNRLFLSGVVSVVICFLL